MISRINGIYSGYFTGMGGNGIALFLIRDGVIVGADVATIFDGNYKWNEAANAMEGEVSVSIKAGSASIQGVPTGEGGIKYTMKLLLPLDFASLPFVTFGTPLGPVNARFEKIRDL